MYGFFQKQLNIDDRKLPPSQDISKNLSKQDIVRASDFNFLTVLGKGSFGKVSGLWSELVYLNVP